MSQIDLRNIDSFILNERCKIIEEAEELLYIGRGVSSTLYIDLSGLKGITHIINAKLILFTVPLNNRYKLHDKMEYSIAPLLDFINVYDECYTWPKIDDTNEIAFEIDKKQSYIEVDVTTIVKKWMSNELENKGVCIKGHSEYSCVGFAGNLFEVKHMHPFLRVQYESCEQGLYPIHHNIIELPTQVSIL